jgi:hypothetical protein
MIEEKLRGIIKKQAHDKAMADAIDNAGNAAVIYKRVDAMVIRKRKTC